MKVSELEILRAPDETPVVRKRKILDPYFCNNAETQVGCQFEYEDGTILNATVSDTDEGNPDWAEIFDLFTKEEIQKNTQMMLDRNRKEREERERIDMENAEKMKADILFQAKLEAFEIEEIKNSQNRELKSKIRKSKNLTELQAYAAVLVMKELETGEASE
jgi:hypothetical protein